MTTGKRPALTVTRDSDGGLTIHDPQSDLVVSLIATHPDVSGPRGLFVEVYAYRGGDVLAQDAAQLFTPDHSDLLPLRTGVLHHPTIAFYAVTEGPDADAVMDGDAPPSGRDGRDVFRSQEG